MEICLSKGYCYGKSFFIHAVLACSCLSIVFNTSFAQKIDKPLPPLSVVKGKLHYVPDSLGNRIPDFSYCGYKAGEQIIPDAAIKIVVPVSDGDATLRIQSAIDYVSKLPAGASGLRGAVLLQKGKYKVEGSLQFHTSGVVLRGSGMNNDGTTIIGAGKDRTTVTTPAWFGLGECKLVTNIEATVSGNVMTIDSAYFQDKCFGDYYVDATGTMIKDSMFLTVFLSTPTGAETCTFAGRKIADTAANLNL